MVSSFHVCQMPSRFSSGKLKSFVTPRFQPLLSFSILGMDASIFISSRNNLQLFASLGPLVRMVFAGRNSGHLGPTLIGSICRVHCCTIFGAGLDTSATVDLVGPRAIEQTWNSWWWSLFLVGIVATSCKETKDDDMFTRVYLVVFLSGFKAKLRQKKLR